MCVCIPAAAVQRVGLILLCMLRELASRSTPCCVTLLPMSALETALQQGLRSPAAAPTPSSSPARCCCSPARSTPSLYAHRHNRLHIWIGLLAICQQPALLVLPVADVVWPSAALDGVYSAPHSLLQPFDRAQGQDLRPSFTATCCRRRGSLQRADQAIAAGRASSRQVRWSLPSFISKLTPS